MQLPILTQILLLLGSAIMLSLAMYLLSKYRRLFAGIKSIWLRRNLAVLVVASCFMFAFSSEIFIKVGEKGLVMNILKQLLQSAIIVFFVFNTVWLISSLPRVKTMSFIKHHSVIVISIVVSAFLIYSLLNYVDNGMKFKDLQETLRFSFYNAFATGLIYTSVNYVELDRKRKLNEKELEVARLSALKTKAELDALHSKVNPHFLYNALNSIADLSITDGKKARRMTIALADLFRYSINYSQNNFSTLNDEVAMSEVYLQIEKIRFEDQLNYTVNVDEAAGHYLVPRFILQPLVENAVKHGLKVTGQMTEILLEVKKEGEGMVIVLSDNGPAFPDEMMPGYGVKSVYDKMDLLFPGQYEIHFSNVPRKQVSIHILKLMKNEPVV